VRALFADITKVTPRDEAAEKAFLAGTMHTVRTHPTLDHPARQAAESGGGVEAAVALTPT
jgi:hypothetical protein